MRKKSKAGQVAIAAVIIIGVIALAGMLFFDHTKKSEGQKKLQAVHDEIGPLEKEYTELSEQNSQMKKDLDEKAIGTKSLLLTVDSMEQSVYDIVYPKMTELGYHGTLVLSDGQVPGKADNMYSRKAFAGMLSDGWDYAVSVSAQTSADDISEWKQSLEDAIAKWEAAGIEIPAVYVCKTGQYQDAMNEVLQEKGFSFVVNVQEDTIELSASYDDSWSVFDSVYLKEVLSNVTTMMKSAQTAGKSMGISFGMVTEEVTDDSTQLSVNKFEQLLDQVKDMQDKGFAICNASEYRADHQRTNEEMAQLKEQYDAAVADNEARMQEIEQRKEEIWNEN